MKASATNRRMGPGATFRACLCLGWLAGALSLGATVASGQGSTPLKPADRSTPRAALQTFLEAGDAFGRYAEQDYLRSPSRAKFDVLERLGDQRNHALDLSGVAQASRARAGYAAANFLYEVLNRIALPAPERIPDTDQLKSAAGTEAERWGRVRASWRPTAA